MKRKICIISSVHTINDTRIYNRQAVSLSKHFDVEFYALGDRNNCFIDENGIRVNSLKKYSKRYLRFINWFRLLYYSFKTRAKVIHFHDPDLILLGLIIKLFSKKKVVYDVHENYSKAILSKGWIPESLRKVVSVFFDRIEMSATKSFDMNLVVTDDLKQRFYKRKVDTIKNYPLVPADVENEIDEEFLINQKNYDSIQLVYIGGVSRVRGIYEMFEAIDYLDNSYDVNLKIIGKFSNNKLKADVFNKVKGKKIEILKPVDYKTLFSIIKNCHIGMVCFHPAPNHYDALPNKMFEYLAAGLPVIASNFDHWDEIIKTYNIGITVDPLDPVSIAKGIESLIKDKQNLRELSLNARTAYEKEFNWKTQEEKLINIYNSLYGF